jgi:hypothetical protein
MRSILLLIALALGGIGTASLVSVGGKSDATAVSQATADAAACGAVDFDHNDAGTAVDGIKKSTTVRRCEPDVGAPTRINMVAALYGRCEPVSGDGGCAPPLQVQSWPACERNLALYEKYPGPGGATIEYTEIVIRGAPAAIFDNGHRIEVYTGDATIVVFGENEALTRAAAHRLTGVHGDRVVPRTEAFPAPAAGAIAGKLTC